MVPFVIPCADLARKGKGWSWKDVKKLHTLTNKYWGTVVKHWHNIPIPAAQKLLEHCQSPFFPLTLFATSEKYSVRQRTCQRAAEHCSSLNRSDKSSWVQFAGHSHMQVASVCGKGSFENGEKTGTPLQARAGKGLWKQPCTYYSHSSIGLSQDMWDCGRRGCWQAREPSILSLLGPRVSWMLQRTALKCIWKRLDWKWSTAVSLQVHTGKYS